jgi:outer membrane receptor protein involved in Fe transport
MKKLCIRLFLSFATSVFCMVSIMGQEIKGQEKKEKKATEQKIEGQEKTKEEKVPGEQAAAEQRPVHKKKTSDYAPGEIIVRAKALANVEDASITTEITAESIKSRSEQTLDQALETVPGVNVYEGRKGQMNFDMHGFGHNSVAILVDGLPFEEMYDGGGGDISRIAVMNASRIVVNRGTSSALYGSRGAFGSVNVITKMPERLFFEGGADIDQYGGFSVNASGGGAYKGAYFLLSASAIKSNSYEISSRLGRIKRLNWMNRLIPWPAYGYTPDSTLLTTTGLEYILDSGRWNHTESVKYYASGKGGYKINRNIEAGVSVNYYQGQFNFNGFETSSYSSYVEDGTWSDPQAGRMLQNRAWEWPKDFRVNVAPYLTLDFGDFNMRAIYYFTMQANVLYGWTNQAQTALFDRGKASEHDEKSNGMYIYPSYKFAKWNKLTALLHYRLDEYDAYKKRVGVFASAPDNWYTPWFKTALMAAHYIDFAIEDEFRFKTDGGNLRFSLGLSYDAQMLSRNLGGRYDLTQTYAPPSIKTPVEDITGILRPRVKVNPTSDLWGTGDSFDPVVALLYEPLPETLKIRGTLSRKVKFPTLHEYSDTADVVDAYFFNPANAVYLPLVILLNQIKPEHAYNASFGIELSFFNKALHLREDYFYSYYQNKIVSIGDPNSDVGNKRWTNIQGSEVHGLESTIGSTIGTDLLKVAEMNVSATYVLTSAKDRLGSHAVLGERVADVPMHQVVLQMKWDFISGTGLNIWGNALFNQIEYVQKLPTSILGTPSLYTTKVYGTRRLHDSFMLNIKVSQKIFDHFDLWVMCKNVTDDYSFDPLNPGPGRTFYFGGDVEF